MGWRYGTTDADTLTPGQRLRGAESGLRITLIERKPGGWSVATARGVEWVSDSQMRYFEPLGAA